MLLFRERIMSGGGVFLEIFFGFWLFDRAFIIIIRFFVYGEELIIKNRVMEGYIFWGFKILVVGI